LLDVECCLALSASRSSAVALDKKTIASQQESLKPLLDSSHDTVSALQTQILLQKKTSAITQEWSAEVRVLA
jgi:hypothetical protein